MLACTARANAPRRQIKRDFPHYVEIEIPGSGLQERVAVIDGWLDANAGKGNYAFTRRHERATIGEWLQVRFSVSPRAA